jgi:hypothetical protein
MSKWNEPQAAFVAVCGNFAEGFTFVGPYPYFDTAAIMHPGPDVWIATMHAPPDTGRENESL